MTETVKPKLWAVIEIMGHKRIAGEVSEEVMFGVPLMRVDVPETKTHKPFVRYFGGSSIHSFTPMDEASVRRAAEWLDESPSILPGVIESPSLAEKERIQQLFGGADYYSRYDFGGSDDDGSDYDDDHDPYDDWDDGDDDDDPDDDFDGESYTPNPFKSIVSMERGETSGSKSPMWRCITLDDEKVNVFKHEKAERDTFHLFQEAGYGPIMEGMKLNDVLTWKQCPISVTMSKNGSWWEVTRVYQMSSEDKPEIGRDDDKSKAAAAAWAKALIDEDDFVVLDTETTGLNLGGKNDEPVQVAVVASDGTVLLDTLVKPTVSVDDEAAAMHHITAEMLADAPKFADIRDKLQEVIGSKLIISYNAAYDNRILSNARVAAGVPFLENSWQCAMLNYAEFYGEWNQHHADYKNQSLSKACEQQGVGEVRDPITDITAPAHSALGDCLRTLALIKKMAAYDPHPF